MTQLGALENQRVLYKKIVIEHFRKNSGYFVVYSKDDVFVQLLKQVIKDLGLAIENLFTVVQNDFELLRCVKELRDHNKRIVFFVELDESGIMEFFLRQLKFTYPTINIIALVNLKQKEKTKGADYCDNAIVRPISKESLLEKIVFTIKPQVNFGRLIDAGRTLLAQRNYENAEQFAQAILDKKPGSMAGLLLLGDIYKEQGLLRNAEMEYIKAHNFVPTALEPLIALVNVARMQNDQKKLQDYMEQTIAIASEEEKKFLEEEGYAVDMHASLTNEERERGLREIYAELAKLVTKAIPYFQEEKIQSGIVFINSFLQAKENYIEKEDGLLYEKVAQFYRSLHKPREAIRAYQRCIMLLPKRAETHYQLAVTYYEEGFSEQAFLLAKKLLQLNPRYGYNSSQTAHNLSLIFEKAGEEETGKFWARVGAELEKREQKNKQNQNK